MTRSAHPLDNVQQLLAVDFARVAARHACERFHNIAERGSLVGDEALSVDDPEVFAGSAFVLTLLLDGCARAIVCQSELQD